MKKLPVLFALASFALIGCNSNDNDPISIEGATFTRSSFVLETPVDANGDGVFSTDLMLENFCFDLALSFLESKTNSIPTNDLIFLRIEDDGNGNNMQTLDCSHGDGPGMDYILTEDAIQFYFSDDLNYIGILSADGNTITIQVPNRHIFPFVNTNRILNSDGSITNYEGDATLVYTRQ